MRGMILAAGRGLRMGALTEHIPKPLLRIKNHYLIEYAIEALTKIGIKEIVINVSYQGEQIKTMLGNGDRYHARFYYSEEESALETGGGIVKALPMLGNHPFIVLSADVICDYPLAQLRQHPKRLAHLVLVKNPDFLPHGDFSIVGEEVCFKNGQTFTYANIGVYHPSFFNECKLKRFRLADLLKKSIEKKLVTGEFYEGVWHNLGTPKDLDRCLEDPRV